VLAVRNALLMASVAMSVLIVLLYIRSGVVGRELISPSGPLNLDLPAPLNSVESKINGKPGMNRLDWNIPSPLVSCLLSTLQLLHSFIHSTKSVSFIHSTCPSLTHFMVVPI
jgi:hypothetical protein